MRITLIEQDIPERIAIIFQALLSGYAGGDVRRTIGSIQRNIDTGGALELGIVLKPAGRLIGLCELDDIGRNTAEAGYMLNRVYRGRGLMHRALKNFLVVYPAALDLASITANVERANGRSIRTSTSLGFRLLREEDADRIYVLRTAS